MNKNYTYTFSKGNVLVKSDARIKQDGQVLTIQNLNLLDSGIYSCSFYNENGNKIGGHSLGYFVVSQGIFLLKHLPITTCSGLPGVCTGVFSNRDILDRIISFTEKRHLKNIFLHP